MPIRRLRQYLDDHRVKYVSIVHSPAFTAQEIAASAHIPGHEIAKTVMVKVDGVLAMAVLPAPMHVDLDRLRDVTGAKSVTLATESDFKEQFPGCELGAMPPFGNLYDMDVYVAESLTHDELIAFNAGTHTELIRMAYADLERLVQPKVLAFAT